MHNNPHNEWPARLTKWWGKRLDRPVEWISVRVEPHKNTWWGSNCANIITGMAFMLKLPFFLGLWASNNYFVHAGCVIGIAVLFTFDGIDGGVARRTGTVSNVGALADPVCDLIALACLIATMYHRLWPAMSHYERNLLGLLLIGFGLIELLTGGINLGRKKHYKRRGKVAGALPRGKVKLVVAFGLSLLSWLIPSAEVAGRYMIAVLALSVALGAWSVAEYWTDYEKRRYFID